MSRALPLMLVLGLTASCQRTSPRSLTLEETRQLRPVVRQRALTAPEVDQLCATLAGPDSLASLSAIAILSHPNAQAGYDPTQKTKVREALRQAEQSQNPEVKRGATAARERLGPGR